MAAINKIDKSANVWSLATGALHNDKQIILHWLQAIPSGRGAKYQRERLLQSMKGLLAALIEQGGEGGPFAAGTINNYFQSIRRIVAWMTERGIWAFRDLKPGQIVDYILFRQVSNGGPISAGTVNDIKKVFRMMWLLRDKYMMPLKFDPLIVESEINLHVLIRQNAPWKHLDENLALPLVKDALDWIRSNGPVVANLVRRIWSERRKYVGLTKLESDRRVRRHYAELLVAPELQRIADQLGMADALPNAIVARAITATEGACTVALLFLVGMRASEFVRLDADCLAQLGEPGLNQRTVLKGYAAKRSGMPRTWAASPDVVEVVQFLVNLYEDIRAATGQLALIPGKTNGAPIPLPGRKNVRLGSESLGPRLHAFANSPHRGVSVKIRLHAHMARKTYARFVVMRDKSALESLAYHYGHTHSAITDGAYVGVDISLARLLREEDRADLAEALMDLLSSGTLGGKAGKNVMNLTRQDLSGKSFFRGKRSLRAIVDKMIDDGVRLAPCDWGYCVYSKATSACGGDDTGPNRLRRAPDVCATCSNFSVTDKHKSYWNERLQRDDEFLRRPDLPDQTKQVVRTRAAHSRAVLVSLTRNHVETK